MSRVFVIPTLIVAGFGKTDPQQAAFTQTTIGADPDPANGTLFQIFKQQHLVTLAQHRSHSSHSSHSSHRSGSSGGGHYSHSSHSSHRSSSGGYDYGTPAPAPVYSPPPSTSTGSGSSSSTGTASPQPLYDSSGSSPPSTPSPELPALSGRTKKFERIVRLVQVGLMAQGFYNGPLNGSVGPLTRSALRKFQEDRGLSTTGTITPETLDALRVPSE